MSMGVRLVLADAIDRYLEVDMLCVRVERLR